MQTHRHEMLQQRIQEESALFFEREGNRTSLISVTRVNLSHDNKNATIFISVLPDAKEPMALEFCTRKLGELRTHLQHTFKRAHIPYLDIRIDNGEKNRIQVEQALRESKID